MGGLINIDEQGAGNRSFSSFRKIQKEASERIQIEVIYLDNFFCVVNKPFGLPSQSAKANTPTVASLLAVQLKKPLDNLHLINRLDQPVGGLMLIAFSGEVHAEFEKIRQQGLISKYYLAVTLAGPDNTTGELNNHLKKNTRLNQSFVVNPDTPRAKAASLSYQKIAEEKITDSEYLTLLSIKLKTGRHHQIRTQLANAGWPVWGDYKYCPDKLRLWMQRQSETGQPLHGKSGADGISLVSYQLTFRHPYNHKNLNFQLKQPDWYPFSLFSDFISL